MERQILQTDSETPTRKRFTLIESNASHEASRRQLLRSNSERLIRKRFTLIESNASHEASRRQLLRSNSERLIRKRFTLIESNASHEASRRQLLRSNSERLIRKRFTLIELLVVIAIIGALAAMILPAIIRVRYQARNTICVNQTKQMYLGIASYTTDHDDYYPDSEYGRELPSVVAEESEFDLRPTLREYFGSELNVIMKCPLTSPFWHYNGAKTETAHYYADIDTYGLGAAKEAKSPYNFYFTGHPDVVRGVSWQMASGMARVDESFAMNDYDGTFRVLISDFVYHKRSDGVYTAHSGRGGGGVEGGNFTNFNVGYLFATGTSDANYCLDDGSIRSYWDVSLAGKTDGSYLSFRPSSDGYLIPLDLMDR